MPEGLERIGVIIVGSIIILIGGVLYWLFHVGLLITSPIFSYKEGVLLIIMVGVILIIVAIVKK